MARRPREARAAPAAYEASLHPPGEPLETSYVRTLLPRLAARAEGVAIGTSPVPYRLDYKLETTTAFVHLPAALDELR
jgi:hypothetical protein